MSETKKDHVLAVGSIDPSDSISCLRAAIKSLDCTLHINFCAENWKISIFVAKNTFKKVIFCPDIRNVPICGPKIQVECALCSVHPPFAK